MKKLLCFVFVTLFFSLSAFAQTEGINFQGVARNAAGEVLVSQKISLRLSVLLGSESGAVAYVETRLATTNPQGIFSLVVGDGNAISKTGNFSSIDWGTASKFIKVEMDPNAGNNFLMMGTSRMQAVPFAFYAYGVDAENVKGILPLGSGGTGVASISELKTSLGLDQVNNTALDSKVDKVAGKGLSTNDYTTTEKTKLAAITGTNTGDQDLSSYATIAMVNAIDVTSSLATKVDKVTGKELSTNDFTTAEKTKLAAITGTNTGDQVNITGNAGTATKLQSSVTINGIAFDGSANITVPGGVPYSGATQAVDLGAYELKTSLLNGITVGKGGGNDSTNTAIGYLALPSNTTGSFNTASGAGSLFSNTTGDGNTATGLEALASNTTGSSNTAFGFGALSLNVQGSDNTAIGNSANVGSDSLTNATAIGFGAIVNTSNTIQLGNTDVTNVNTTGAITAGGKIIAGASSASSTSAVMEANSTTQGFLPPRLTTTQRDAITSPVAGLTIWNTTNTQLEVYDGSYWKNMVGLLVSPLEVGDEYGGGKVFYIFGPSDNGYIKGQTHGLIAALEDQTTDAGVKWFPEKFYGATGTYIGLGLPNTLGIIASAVITGTTNMSSFAAGLANSYRGGGYMDWYLPSIDELKKMYENRDAIGGFATSGIPSYWSSTQKGGISFTNFTSFANGVTNARIQFFYTGGSPIQNAGTVSDTGIDNLRRVRAIRIF